MTARLTTIAKKHSAKKKVVARKKRRATLWVANSHSCGNWCLDQFTPMRHTGMVAEFFAARPVNAKSAVRGSGDWGRP